MSDETKDNVSNIADASMAKALGLKPSSVTVVELNGEDEFWKTTPLAVVAGLTRAVAMLGLKKGTDWPSKLKEGDPMYEAWAACSHLGDALEKLQEAATEWRESPRPGAAKAALQLDAWAASLLALMEQMHLSGWQTYRLAKAQHELMAERESHRGRPK